MPSVMIPAAPRQRKQNNLVEFLINIANILYILSYFVQDLMRIRLLTLIGASILVLYFYLQPEPIMTIIYWNVFFILLNLFQMLRILRHRKTGIDPVQLLIDVLKRRLRKLERKSNFSLYRQLSTGQLP